MHRTSMFGIVLDLARSKGSHLYDLKRNEALLDLFGLYSSLPLGYNHPIFDGPSFKQAMLTAASVKVPNCEMATPSGDEFAAAFTGHPAMAPFRYFHFACTGALGIEAAIKAAIDHRKSKNPRVITFKESFHGINSYGGLLTDWFGSVRQRLQGFPDHPWGQPLDNPVIRYQDANPVIDAALTDRVLDEIRATVKRDSARDVAAVLVEPIQCTAGDLRFDPRFLRELRTICTEFDVPLVFDEVQTGFGGTGTMWYFEQCGFVPDLVVFGKKAQTSGVMVREAFGEIFRQPLRLEVTWDGDLLDMIRCTYVLRAYDRYRILDNVRERGEWIEQQLSALPKIRNIRRAGLLIAFDFENRAERDAYVRAMRERRVIVLSTQESTVRWRPNLAVTEEDARLAIAESANALEATTFAGAGR